MAKGKNKQPKKIGGRAKKEKIIALLSQKVQKAKGIVFVNNQGLTNTQVELLKTSLRPLEAEFVVTKNTLLKLSLENSKLNPPAGGQNSKLTLEGQTATVFFNADVVLPLKQLVKTAKDTGLLGLKIGIIDGQLTTAESLQKLSTLPSRDVLIAQLVGGMKTPIYGLHRAMSWNIQKLVLTLSAVARQKT